MSDPPPTAAGPDVAPDPEKNPESLVGSTLAGRYRIVRFLGRGAMGSVYVGEHVKIGRRDAIKVLRSSLARDREAVARFTRGARNASAIRHPNVCTVYDFSDTAEGLQFLAMELVDGESLSDLMEREGPLPPERAVRIAVQAAAALEAAHELDIVHRDFKPDNVMIARERDGSDLVKVVDFDIAKGSREGEGSGVTRLGFVVGTPEYMSPEQLTGDALDGRSDVYSLALVLFRMITGELPFRTRSTQELMVERLTGDPLTLHDVMPDRSFPPGLEAALRRAMARDRENRPASAREFALEVWEATFGGTGATGSGTPGERPSPEGLPPTLVAPAAEAPPEATPSPSRLRLPGGRKTLLAGGGVVVVGLLLAVGLLSGGAEPASVVLPAAIPLAVGDTARVTARVLDADGAELEDQGIRWASSAPEVASVDDSGLLRALREGTAELRASAGEAEAVASVRVSARGPGPGSAPRLARRELAFRVGAGEPPPAAERVQLVGGEGGVEGLVASVAYPGGDARPWLDARVDAGSVPPAVVVGPGEVPAPGRHVARVVVGPEGGGTGDTLSVTLEVTASREEPGPSERLSVTAANARAWDQLFHLTDDPSSATRRAVKDTTQALWEATYLPDSVRARAAYAYAQAAVELDEMAEGLRWAQRAATLVPGNGTYEDYVAELRRRVR